MRRILYWLTIGVLLMLLTPAPAQSETTESLPEATAQQLPRWRGFNLLEKFHLQWSNGPFREDDFRWIHEWGFNFVRLPMDYRIWIEDGDWNQFDETQLRHIDQAVEWGQKYSVHVCINFHRAPGYTVAHPPEATNLWNDPNAQEVCAKHWAMFAKRYRGIPGNQLSFNLFNEPSDVAAAAYVEVVRKMAAAIRAEDPQRLIISDGLQWGQHPIPELAKLNIAQATRGYTPMDITHFKANWVDGANQYAEPAWPRVRAFGTLYAPGKPDLSPEAMMPLVVTGNFDRSTPLRVRLNVVSSRATLVAKADGEEMWRKSFVCGPGTGEWREVKYSERYGIYQNVYDRDYEMTIPAGTTRVELALEDGDWLTLSELGLRRADGREDQVALRAGWDQPTAQLAYRADAGERPFVASEMEDRQWLWNTAIVPWEQARKSGIGVIVGEFGCFNKTPHRVTLAWMEDCLANWRQANMGWALWNFRGSFGVLDSQRKDVQYEDFHGHQLDRQMLDLLQRY